MTDSLKTPSAKLGLPPGSLIHVGDVLETETRMSVIDYSSGHLEKTNISNIDDILKYRDSDSVTWLTIEGLANVEIVQRIGEIMDIHHLVLEDILNTNQRPKFEEYDDHLFIVLKCLLVDEDEDFDVSYEQISLLVLKNFVIMFKEKQDDIFQPLQKRIKASKSKLRTLGTDYLTYAILDSIVDQNFVLLDSLDETVTILEDRLLDSEPTKELLHTIQKLKREIVAIRRYISPARELLSAMLRSDSALIGDSTHLYFRDVLDHTLRVIESIESYRDILTGLLEIYTSSVSNKMNEVMKVLTIFTSIFTPLTFIVGIYGMNFVNMPELKWSWAYPVLWGVFIIIPLGLFVYFKKKKWV
ncbi:magnesium/cobalt transporter CorA [Leucothrix pacifica]|uniref:Magnesium transport protein CorA n=1 Tax=Leucothrix pacifica TaxID=1247513 RepID=A0A317CCZ2_9GAMM|nr:magnesium/cobalt transporter CorA [Leucothrix pacifica]PWQ96504.1 magnesium and cobalt transport protein CorA [Leucothrix pacifica]